MKQKTKSAQRSIQSTIHIEKLRLINKNLINNKKDNQKLKHGGKELK